MTDMSHLPIDEAVLDLAIEFSRQRTNGQVYMGGEHNPLPTEMSKARRFINNLLVIGWQPPEPDED